MSSQYFPKVLSSAGKFPEKLFGTIGNTPPGKIIGGKFYRHPVTGKNSNVKLSHLARYMSENNMAVVQLDTKHGVRQGLDHLAFNFDCFFLGQNHLRNEMLIN